MFRPERRDKALFTPPANMRVILRMARFWESIGRVLVPQLAGVTLTEAVKDVYAAVPAKAVGRRIVVAFGSSVSGSFLKKKNQKTFVYLACAAGQNRDSDPKVFLLLFFRKRKFFPYAACFDSSRISSTLRSTRSTMWSIMFRPSIV